MKSNRIVLLQKLRKIRQNHKILTDFGPSGETRTPGILLPKQARYQLRYTRLWNCFICGLSCGLGRFLTSGFAEMVPASGSVPAGCGVGLFSSWMGPVCSQMWRPTNFAIPGYSLFCHDTTASDKNKVFSVCGHSCGQSRFYTAFGNRGKSRKRRRCKALRRFALTRPGYRHGTPKPGAIPTSLYPDTTHYYSRSKCVCPVLYIAFCILWNPAF